MESENLDSFLKEEFTEMTFDFDPKSMYTFERIGYYWMNEKNVTKYPKPCATVELSL